MAQLRQLLSATKTLLYRRPRDELQRLLRWGPVAYVRCGAWAREMEAAAWELPISSPDDAGLPSLEVWFLTGQRFWYQTAFCAWTLAKHSNRGVVLNLVDDGTLEPRHEAGLRRLFPAGMTVTRASIQARLDQHLPAWKFPILRQRWLDYVHLRKLTDIHLGSEGLKLVLDSDMLFFRRPEALLVWWDRNQGLVSSGPTAGDSSFHPSAFSPCLMTDCVESYGYSRALMQELAGAEIPPLLNVGICGLRSECLDWEQLEHWCRTLWEREGTSYYLEQALVAMIAARHSPTVMLPQDYITFPSRDQVLKSGGVLQHYVADSKPWYFGSAWKLAMY